MKQYYSGPMMKVTASNPRLVNQHYEYDTNVEVIDRHALFYYNWFNVLVRKENGYPVVLKEELFDLFQSDFSNNNQKPSSYYCTDPNKLTPVKEQEKQKSKVKQFMERVNSLSPKK